MFDKGGITGGVWSSKGGMTVRRREHRHELEEGDLPGSVGASKNGKEDTMIEKVE